MKTPAKKPASLPDKLQAGIDRTQGAHPALSFPYAVIRKYSDDHAGYLAALVTYYGFLSLFPLLIVATAIGQIISSNNAAVRERLLNDVASYFPALGDSLVDSIHTSSKTGFALVIGLTVTFYGAKRVADATQHALDTIWGVPRIKRTGFPHASLRSLGIVAYAGLGFLGAASLTGLATARGTALPLRLGISILSFVVLLAVFWGVLTFCSSARRRPLANIPGAFMAAGGMLVLQAIGTYLISHELRNQSGLNAQFAAVLALLFWIYLQAQVFMLAAELNSVRALRLWPRSTASNPKTPGDEKAYALYQRREAFAISHSPTVKG